ncbi:jg8773 [Pararge aegeria aegeria]|uniref:Jg8773 protein n=1 Tax=Pararge aegeria aegeria TaxID=348720 RepID=A0A8S4S092_9NEOP|nr:jg8773 [Pararge aegeria aegeria]
MPCGRGGGSAMVRCCECGLRMCPDNVCACQHLRRCWQAQTLSGRGELWRRPGPRYEVLDRGAFVSFRRASDCWALRIFLLVSLASANHADAAYVRMGRSYVLYTPSFVRSGKRDLQVLKNRFPYISRPV